jgi:hypothetical protein
MTNADTVELYLESGQSRTFAVALDWPGWCRSGRDEAAALQALADYAPRYAAVLQPTGLAFPSPTEFVVVERLTGNATTDFGAPDRSPSADATPADPTEFQRWEIILKACWAAFDQAVQQAEGKALRKGPRGGGRDLPKIIEHMRDANLGYMGSLGGKFKPSDAGDALSMLPAIRQAILTTLDAAVRGEIPAQGPRGGLRWTPRYFVRRLAWHELDHAWEIEDRAG